MKKIIKISLALFIISTFFLANSFSQGSDGIIFFGVDFTKARLVGTEGFTNPQHLQSSYLRQWNNLIENESEKYDLSKALGESDIVYFQDVVNDRNDEIDPDVLVTNKSHKTTKEDVQAVVSALGNEEHSSGTGAIIVIESFDKHKVLGTMWLTTFDIATLEVIKTKKMSAKPRGFGVRNFWARTIFLVLDRADEEF